jgi:hypothetical protein
MKINKTEMKDYRNQILAILKSSFNQKYLQDSVYSKVLRLSGISEAIDEINAMIQNEVAALEQQIVDLTEQLSETDSLLIEVKKVKTPRISHSKPGSVIRKISRTVKLKNEYVN